MFGCSEFKVNDILEKVRMVTREEAPKWPKFNMGFGHSLFCLFLTFFVM